MNRTESNTKSTEFMRQCVVAIQGGGIYGLSLLGQLQAVYDLQLPPAAFAGTSAGAIISTLAWSGYSPREIQGYFASIAQSAGGLTSLLAPPDENSDLALSKLTGFWERRPRTGGWLRWLPYVLGKRGFIKRVWDQFDSRGGVFAAQGIETFLDQLLKNSPQFGNLYSKEPRGTALTFGLIQRWVDLNYLAVQPLYLVATALGKREPVIIDSTDNEFSFVSVAAAARASGGFPGLLMPRELPVGPKGDYFADGGIVLNFPAYVLQEKLTRALNKPRVPYATVGLRFAPSPAPPDWQPRGKQVLGSLFHLATGGARKWLEDQLAQWCPHTMYVSQLSSQTGAPGTTMEVHKIGVNHVKDMFDAGYNTAISQLSAFKFALPTGTEAAPIFEALDDLISQAVPLIGTDQNHLRANVFVAVKVGSSVKLALKYAVNMHGDPDVDMVFDVGQGLTGVVYSRRQALCCDLDQVKQLMDREDPGVLELFKLTKQLQGKVKAGRKFLISTFIPDMIDWGYTLSRVNQASVIKGSPFLNPSHPPITFGVVNLDSAIAVDLVTPSRSLGALYSAITIASYRVGLVLTEYFARKL